MAVAEFFDTEAQVLVDGGDGAVGECRVQAVSSGDVTAGDGFAVDLLGPDGVDSEGRLFVERGEDSLGDGLGGHGGRVVVVEERRGENGSEKGRGSQPGVSYEHKKLWRFVGEASGP